MLLQKHLGVEHGATACHLPFLGIPLTKQILSVKGKVVVNDDNRKLTHLYSFRAESRDTGTPQT